MAAVASVTVTVDPPAVKKRGRPRKVVDEGAVASEMPAVRKASTKAKAATKAKSKAKTIDALKEKKKTLTKVSDYKAKKGPPASKAAPAEIAEQATPATPTSSKILDEVRATGAFDKPPAEPQEPFLPPVPGPAPVAPILPAAASTSIGAASQEVPEAHYEPPSPSSSATGAPIQQPVDEAHSRPVIPPTTAAPTERAKSVPPNQRATTIPLPRNPLAAPSPHSEIPKPRIAFAEPAARAPPRAPRFPTRMIEPTPNTKLPPKYKKAARQVTTIIVGIPIILVVGYELYGRWKMQINTKFEERELRRIEPKPLSVVGEK